MIQLAFSKLSRAQQCLVDALYRRQPDDAPASTWRSLRNSGWITPGPGNELTHAGIKAYQYWLAWEVDRIDPRQPAANPLIVIHGRKISMSFYRKLQRAQEQAAAGLQQMNREVVGN